ncbi:MAG: ornithine cyclodeaminase family protein [Halobacteria archaeon]|nr:ornithine cyclodeaminase family protein [Halobacteria archaeon]
MKTLLLGPDDITESIDIQESIDAVESAFEAHGKDEDEMPAKTYIDLPQYNGDFRAMPAFVNDSAGVKWVNSHPDNPEKHGLPTVMGVMIYSDPETAYPLAVLDGTTLTKYRTGAAAGVASKYLAPPDSDSLGLVGAGAQAHTQLSAVSSVFDIDEVVVSDIDEDAAKDFVDELREEYESIEARVGSAEEAAGCDIVSTTTPSREPVIQSDWVSEGTHINAMGADAEGKQELDPGILTDSDTKVVIDDWEQCSHSGEINMPYSEGVLKRDDIYADLGSIVAGDTDGRSGDEVTVFDSTGLAIQDVATSRVVYENADEAGIGTEFGLVSD